MPVVRGQFAELLAPGLNPRTNSYQEYPEMYRRISNVQTSAGAFEDDYAVAGFGPLAKKPELNTTILDEPIKLGGVRYFHEAFALGYLISREMLRDGKYPQMLNLAEELGRSSRYTVELYGHDVWNNAFSAAKYAGRDGLALVANNHKVAGTAATVSNMPAIATDLSQAALEAAVANYWLQVDDRGRPIMMQPRYLLVHPSNLMFAQRLLQTPGYPGGNSNDINPLNGLGIQPFASPYFTDEDAWFLVTDPTRLDVRFWWRDAPDTDTWDDLNAKGTFHTIWQRHSVGFGDWRGVYGSPGA